MCSCCKYDDAEAKRLLYRQGGYEVSDFDDEVRFPSSKKKRQKVRRRASRTPRRKARTTGSSTSLISCSASPRCAGRAMPLSAGLRPATSRR